MARKPIVAVTMGDPAGIGPEVIRKALADPRLKGVCSPLILGDWEVLRRAWKGKTNSSKLVCWQPGQALLPLLESHWAGVVCSLSSLATRESRPGRPTKAGGHAAYRYPGHTELLAELSRTPECRMMLIGKKLRVVLVTGHVAFTKVARGLSRDGIGTTLELAHQSLRDFFGIQHPRIAVAALNPHGGEEGIFGDEEEKTIVPAVQAVKRKGIRAYGPFPADSLFYQAARGDYDAVVCMYHDQGLIPLKLHHFFGGVALTLGPPFIRTSVDHGTAYDIAGKGKADESSMKEAILLAARLAQQAMKRRTK
jgi:4-phospho-D-threonate 3-dehydrogenase / 4-phospho-D-erythronate 3-dehydrogenase